MSNSAFSFLIHTTFLFFLTQLYTRRHTHMLYAHTHAHICTPRAKSPIIARAPKRDYGFLGRSQLSAGFRSPSRDFIPATQSSRCVLGSRGRRTAPSPCDTQPCPVFLLSATSSLFKSHIEYSRREERMGGGFRRLRGAKRGAAPRGANSLACPFEMLPLPRAGALRED